MKKSMIFFCVSLISITVLAQNYNVNGDYKISGKVGIGTASPEALLDQVSSNSLIHQRLFWNANNTDAGEVDRAKISFGTKNVSGSTRTWGIYAYSYGLDQGFGGGIRFTSLVGATETEIMRIDNGKVGIGTTSPEALLDQVSSNSLVHQRLFWNASNTDAGEVDRAKISFGTKNVSGSTRTWGIYAYSYGLDQGFGGGIRFTSLVGAAETEIMRIDNGKVGIGTTAPDAPLTVAGRIHSQEVKVTVDAGADFVFDESYDLRTLEETEKFIVKNKHLPEIASEEEMLENGIRIGEMNIKLLQKIEELTLYTIDINKRVNQLETENQELKEKVKTMKTNKNDSKY